MDKLVKRLQELDVVKYGEFTLSSGAKSNFYIDLREAYGDPKARRMMKKGLWKLIPRNVTCIAGSGYGGITLATLVADDHKLGLSLVRDDRKPYGMSRILEGYQPTSRDYVAIVDDILTTGASVRRVINIVKETKAQIVGCYTVVTRYSPELGYPSRSLLTVDQLL